MKKRLENIKKISLYVWRGQLEKTPDFLRLFCVLLLVVVLDLEHVFEKLGMRKFTYLCEVYRKSRKGSSENAQQQQGETRVRISFEPV